MTFGARAKRHKKKLIALGVLVGAPLAAHVIVGQVTKLTPPAISPAALTLTETDGVWLTGG